MFIIQPDDLSKIYGHPTFERNRAKIKELLFVSKRIGRDPQMLLQFQKSVLEYILKIEEFIAKIKSGSEDEKSNVRAYKHLIRVLKWIMDGVALRLLKFDSNAYRVLSESRNPGQQFNKAGLNFEVQKLDEIFAQGEIAILNDITNFLRLGDITKIDYKNHKIKLIECKYNRGKSYTGKNNPNKKTISAQEKKMMEAEEMVNTYTPVPKKKGKGQMTVVPFKACTFLNKLKSEIKKAYRDGQAFCKIDECVKLRIFYKRDFDKVYEILKAECFQTTDEVFLFSNFDTFLDKEGEFFHTVFPFSVLKLPINMVLDLMLGHLFVVIEFNFTSFYLKFESLGYEIIKSAPNKTPSVGEMMSKKTSPLELSPIPSVTLKKNDRTTTLPDTFVARIVFEFICSDSFIELIKFGYQNYASLEGLHNLALFKNHLSLYT